MFTSLPPNSAQRQRDSWIDSALPYLGLAQIRVLFSRCRLSLHLGARTRYSLYPFVDVLQASETAPLRPPRRR